MARAFFDDDADLANLDGRTVAVVGYGNQGRSQALNLRDSGVRVIVGSVRDASAGRAAEDAFEVLPIEDAAKAADIMMMLVPDEIMGVIYEERIAPTLSAGNTLSFASGYNVFFKRIVPPEDVDVVLVAPRMIGKGVRGTFVRGDGFPSLVGVEQDATGHAWDTALALAKGIGSTRSAALECSFREETLVDLAAEQSGSLYLPRLLFEALVEAGCDPSVILLELYASGEMSEVYDAVKEMGFLAQMQLHSRTSQYGQAVAALRHLDLQKTKAGLKEMIAHIDNGGFAEEWEAEQANGLPRLRETLLEGMTHPMQVSENDLYRTLHRRDHDLVEPDWLGSPAPQ